MRHDLDEPVITRYIRIHPVKWYGHISMRAEFYGCRTGGCEESKNNLSDRTKIKTIKTWSIKSLLNLKSVRNSVQVSGYFCAELTSIVEFGFSECQQCINNQAEDSTESL